jgi:alpha-tubulin suppressor-like RCC1 family protein
MDFALGRNHGLALTRDAQIWGWGWNDSGQLGLGRKSECVWEPQLMELPNKEKAVNVFCGEQYSAAITEVGALYVWG